MLVVVNSENNSLFLRLYMFMNFRFLLMLFLACSMQFSFGQTDTIVYQVPMVDESPKWIGCEEKPDADLCSEQHMLKFLKDSLVYPNHAEVSGKVFVQFIIEADGSKSNVIVLRGVDDQLDKEALRVVKLFPNFIPAKIRGRAVRCLFRLPVVFSLR